MNIDFISTYIYTYIDVYIHRKKEGIKQNLFTYRQIRDFIGDKKIKKKRIIIIVKKREIN